MVMNQCALDAVMTRDEQIQGIKTIKEAKAGEHFDVALDDGKFNLVQTLFFLSKAPYQLRIQGDTASWIRS